MRCNYCNNEISDNASTCPKCGKPVTFLGSQFENIVEVKKALKAIVDENGTELFKDSKRFTGLLNDYMPEYEKERRLIRNVLANNVISQMLSEPDQKLAIVKAREYMLNDMFLSDVAAEFILDCVTHMLGWSFTPEIKAPAPAPAPVSAPKERNTVRARAAAPEKAAESNDREIKPKPFKPFDALKYKIIGNVKIPEGYTTINSFAFDGYGFLKTIRIPSTVQAIGEYAFSECKRLRSVELPDGLRAIKKSAFSSCGSLTSISLPYGIDSIEEGTFSFCASLEDIYIPNSVSSIGDEAFEGCESLKYVMIPDSVKFIGSNVFAFCPNVIIRCRENSYVHKFCMTNGLDFEFVR